MGSVAGYVAPSNIPAGTPSHLGCAPTQGQTCKVFQQPPGVERDRRWECFRLCSYLLTELLHPGLPPARPVLSTLTMVCKSDSHPHAWLTWSCTTAKSTISCCLASREATGVGAPSPATLFMASMVTTRQGTSPIFV